MSEAKVKRQMPLYTVGEEIGNAITHGIGTLLAVWGTVMMILKSVDAWQVVSACIYGAALIILGIYVVVKADEG